MGRAVVMVVVVWAVAVTPALATAMAALPFRVQVWSLVTKQLAGAVGQTIATMAPFLTRMAMRGRCHPGHLLRVGPLRAARPHVGLILPIDPTRPVGPSDRLPTARCPITHLHVVHRPTGRVARPTRVGRVHRTTVSTATQMLSGAALAALVSRLTDHSMTVEATRTPAIPAGHMRPVSRRQV